MDARTMEITPERRGLRAQFSMMAEALRASPVRHTVFMLYGGVFSLILATAFGQVLLNRWNQPFYDSLERRDLAAFLDQLMVFAGIAGGLLTLNVGQSWLNQMLHIKLREGFARDLIGEWMRPGRAFRLAYAGEIGINPDQRLHEDVRRLADLTIDLSVELMQAAILLASFVGVLWFISADFAFTINGQSFAVPGYMVWAALLYAALASGLSWLAGRPLVRLNEARYAREAELRFSLMRVNEHVDAISIAGGEVDERRRLERDLASVLGAVRRIMSAAVRLTWVTAGYGWITVVAPIVIASPVYFSGKLSFGGLMMAAAAFTQVNGALRWFVDNIGSIADWRATLFRVADFRSSLIAMDALHGREDRIAIEDNEEARLVLDGLEVATSTGCTKLEAGTIEVAAGERVRVVADPGAGKTMLFRAIAGLWPWGRGRIRRPAGAHVAFVPSRPFIPRGTLAEALTYPDPAVGVSEAAAGAALERMGLGRLVGRLGERVRWDRELNDDEQRLLAFARLILRKPDWIIVDEALDVLDATARGRVLDAFDADLPGAALVTIGTPALRDGRLGRIVRLSRDPAGKSLPKARAAAGRERMPALQEKS